MRIKWPFRNEPSENFSEISSFSKVVGSAVVGSNIKEAQKQLKDENVYKKVKFKDQNLLELADKSNHFFKGLKTKGCVTDKNLKYFTYQYKEGM